MLTKFKQRTPIHRWTHSQLPARLRSPGARGTQSTFKLHDDEEALQNLKKSEPEVICKFTLNLNII